MGSEVAHIHILLRELASLIIGRRSNVTFLEEAEQAANCIDFLGVRVLQVNDLVYTGAFVFNDTVDQSKDEEGQISVTLDIFEDGE